MADLLKKTWLQKISAQTGHIFVRIASLPKGWLSPSGKFYALDRDDLHELWAFNHTNLLGLKNVESFSHGEAYSEFLNSGWIRVSVDGLHFSDLDRSATTIDNYLIENSGKLPRFIAIDAPYGSFKIPKEEILEDGILDTYNHYAKLHTPVEEKLLSDEEILDGVDE